MIKWMRPSGLEIETAEGEGIEAYAKEHGWKRANKSFVELKEVAKTQEAEIKPRRTRRTKAQMEAASREG